MISQILEGVMLEVKMYFAFKFACSIDNDAIETPAKFQSD